MNSSLRLFPSALVAARAFSTKAVSHAPPKKIHGIPGRYAGAVYTAASKVNRNVVQSVIAWQAIQNMGWLELEDLRPNFILSLDIRFIL